METGIDLERLVKLVLGDLGMTPNRSGESPRLIPPTPIVPVAETPVSSQPAARPTPQAAAKPVSSASPDSIAIPVSDALEVRLTSRVITLASLGALPTGPAARGAKRVVVPRGAVITPSARDELKKRRLELIFAVGTTSASNLVEETKTVENHVALATESGLAGIAGLVSPVVGSASYASFGSTRVAAGVTTFNRGIIADREIFLAWHLLRPETVARSFTDHLEKAGRVTVYQSSCVVETAWALADYLAQRPTGCGIVMTGYSAVAAAVLNRARAIRAIVGFETKQVETEAGQLGANVLVLDPNRSGFFPVLQMTKTFLAGGPRDCPSILRKGLEP